MDGTALALVSAWEGDAGKVRKMCLPLTTSGAAQGNDFLVKVNASVGNAKASGRTKHRASLSLSTGLASFATGLPEAYGVDTQPAPRERATMRRTPNWRCDTLGVLGQCSKEVAWLSEPSRVMALGLVSIGLPAPRYDSPLPPSAENTPTHLQQVNCDLRPP